VAVRDPSLYKGGALHNASAKRGFPRRVLRFPAGTDGIVVLVHPAGTPAARLFDPRGGPS